MFIIGVRCEITLFANAVIEVLIHNNSDLIG